MKYDVFCCVGTQHRARLGEPLRRYRRDRLRLVGGCMQKQERRSDDDGRWWARRGHMAGRGGAMRLKRGDEEDYLVVGLYPPPQPGGGRATGQHRRTVDALSLGSGSCSAAPCGARRPSSTPTSMMSGGGAAAASAATARRLRWEVQGAEATSTAWATRTTTCWRGTTCARTTRSSTAATRDWTAQGVGRRLDDVGVPTGAKEVVIGCNVMHGYGRRLQLTASAVKRY